MKLKCLFITSGAFLLSACTSISQQEAGSINYGDKPVNYDKAIISAIKNNLKDPDSMKVVSITNPYRVYSKCGFGTVKYGWYTTIRYNAKNSYGGYVGEKEFNYAYLNGKYDVGMMCSGGSSNRNGNSILLDEITYLCKGDCPQN